jgi:hydroxyacylglutathione hydrolase
MILRYFYDENLAHASYLVGCAKTGEALVIDPMRHIKPYVDTAEKAGLRITHVTETHIHADFVSGARELAAATGATLYLSDMGDADWKYAFAGEPNVMLVRDGDRWQVGNAQIEVLHTPGHTPEQIAFLLTDRAAADAPMGLFTGDFLFAGDVGRPDLLEEAAGFVGTKEPGARRQFQTIARIRALPDYLQVWPAHGAGSACGKALGAVPSTTLGYERRFNPAFQFSEEEPFVQWLLTGQPEAPRYFAQMKNVNKAGPALLATLPAPQPLSRKAIEAALNNGALVVDLRDAEAYAAGHLPGTLNIPLNNTTFLTQIGWFVDYAQPFYFIAPASAAIDSLLVALRSIGVDHTPGFLVADHLVGEMDQLPAISAAELARRLPRNGLMVIDVRGRSEFSELHISGACNIPLGLLSARLAELPHDRPIVTQCASGYRSQIAASLLRANGFDNVLNLADGVEVWSQQVPTEHGNSQCQLF